MTCLDRDFYDDKHILMKSICARIKYFSPIVKQLTSDPLCNPIISTGFVRLKTSARYISACITGLPVHVIYCYIYTGGTGSPMTLDHTSSL